MPASAQSFAVKAQSPARVARALEAALSSVRRASGGLVFVSGELAAALGDVAADAARTAAGVPLLVVSGAGVLSERGEVEQQSAAAGIVWSGGEVEVLSVDAPAPDDLGEALARQLGDRAARKNPPVLIFVKPEGFSPGVLEPLAQGRGPHQVFGAGAVGEPGLFAVDAEARVNTGGAIAMLLHGMSPPVIRSSPACRLLAPLARITETRGSMVVSIEHEPALDRLTSVGQELSDQPLIFAVLAEEEGAGATHGGRPDVLVRGVQGVDPVRRSLLVSDEVREGMRIAFAVRDGAAARADLEAVTRDLAREIAGAAPRFGLYVNCAGRGSGLYGSYDVDTRILRSRFDKTPLAGMQSSFEIAPHAGKPALQLYTGVVALFTAPS